MTAPILRFALTFWSLARRAPLLLLAVGLGVSACSFTLGPNVAVRSVGLQVAEKANNNAPIAVDLVLITEDKLIDQILALSAADWFSKRAQFQRDYPEGVSVISWEVVPGQVVSASEIERKYRVSAAVIFANYQTSGSHRFRLGEEEKVRILLNERSFTIAQ